MTLEVYRDFRPTEYDRRGMFLDEEQKGWYVCPLNQTRDSEALEVSNFAYAVEACESVDPDGDSHKVHRFSHWGPGWFEIILVRPMSRAHAVAVDIDERLEDYGALDEEDWCEREWTEVCEAWETNGLGYRVEMCARAGVSIFAARRNDFPADDSGTLQELMLGH